MITAIHTLVHSDDATATRAFFKDVLRWPFVSIGTRGDEGAAGASDSDDPSDWLVFGTGPSELGVHPTRVEWQGEVRESPRHHEISLMCDDLETTITELSGRGATFTGEPREMGFGRGVLLQVPGADDILLYQAHYSPATGLR